MYSICGNTHRRGRRRRGVIAGTYSSILLKKSKEKLRYYYPTTLEEIKEKITTTRNNWLNLMPLMGIVVTNVCLQPTACGCGTKVHEIIE